MRPRSVASPRLSTSGLGRVPIVQITAAVAIAVPSASVMDRSLIAVAFAPVRTSTPRLASERSAAAPNRSLSSGSSRARSCRSVTFSSSAATRG